MSESNREGSGYDDERPGLVQDEDLPEDLQPSDDNPLAKDPADAEDASTQGQDDLTDAGPGATPGSL